MNVENGQVAVYDAVNPIAASRRILAQEFAKHHVQVPLNQLFGTTLVLVR